MIIAPSLYCSLAFSPLYYKSFLPYDRETNSPLHSIAATNPWMRFTVWEV